LYDPDLAALAIKQSWGDLVEAIFLLRAYRTTLPRFYYSEPLDTQEMHLQRRISAIYKDVPGGQKLGPTFDYIHRLLDFKLAAEGNEYAVPQAEASGDAVPLVVDMLNQEGLIQQELPAGAEVSTAGKAGAHKQETAATADPWENQPFDLTRQPIQFPADMDTVEAQLEDVAKDMTPYTDANGNAYDYGFGLNYAGVISE
jgi:alpha-D-ribose 1-methylphosphonate 5-triphosphate synthase subunit PhnI